MLLVIFFDFDKEETYCYRARFDCNLVVGDSNSWGDVLIGLFLIYYLRQELIPYRSNWFAQFECVNRCVD